MKTKAKELGKAINDAIINRYILDIESEVEFLKNEVWHLENTPEEIKTTIKNIKKRISELQFKRMESFKHGKK